VDIDELTNLLVHLGYFGASEDVVNEIETQFSEFSAFCFHDFVEVA
jgi:hypothetical protein